MDTKNYLWLSNGTKPKKNEKDSKKSVKLGNVSAPGVEAAINMGYKVFFGTNRANAHELACNYDVQLFNAGIYRSLTDFKSNYEAYKNVMRVLKKDKIDVIHCNTPIGGTLGRLCGKIKKVPTVIYTVHGFHFYKGAPFINRTLLKWAEIWMAHYTDAIITINQEDYQAAQKFKLRHNGKVYYIPGVGVNTADYRFDGFDKDSARQAFGLDENDIVLIAMGDLISRKNYSTSIKAIANAGNSKLHLLICGKGPMLDELKELVKELNLENQIHFLGFRTDVKELLQIADIFLFTTYQEGLPRSMMEAMSAGLPCVASKIRGNVDLIEDGKGGYLCEPDDVEGFAKVINLLATDSDKREEMKKSNLDTIKKYDVENIKKIITEIYSELL